MNFRINKPLKNRCSRIIPHMEVETPLQISPFERPVKPPEEQISYGMFDPRHTGAQGKSHALFGSLNGLSHDYWG